jgi:hypothetical protein
MRNTTPLLLVVFVESRLARLRTLHITAVKEVLIIPPGRLVRTSRLRLTVATHHREDIVEETRPIPLLDLPLSRSGLGALKKRLRLGLPQLHPHSIDQPAAPRPLLSLKPLSGATNLLPNPVYAPVLNSRTSLRRPRVCMSCPPILRHMQEAEASPLLPTTPVTLVEHLSFLPRVQI